MSHDNFHSSWRHLIGWWLVSLSEHEAHVTEINFTSSTKRCVSKSDSSGDSLKTSGQVTEKLRNAFVSMYDERSYFNSYEEKEKLIMATHAIPGIA